MADIRLVRVYDAPQNPDKNSFLTDRLWPRGISKERLKGVVWLKEAAPSTELRKRFHADPTQWQAFCRDYVDELNRQDAWAPLLALLKQGETVTLMFGSRDLEHNQGVVLRDFLLNRLKA
ncbi:MarR family transcriptional regulator [Leminorella grimontii]|uniref:MarR family transcriptional regulator n=1 Tax=Leminorella grimontii TaxID=82981 RepID=A0AAV5N521_9GAMM|nr:DUF488 family protein [Leminorella grimontii]KFC94565.1 YeaO family protein [Leminorella grimontii ATCC 33999 = DSM 5078]GKX56660.1 MarR family transcriptional regulator [Leminorella grimontii]VFS61917.1 Uncharacterized conserved protein [Leminorella grimontii]